MKTLKTARGGKAAATARKALPAAGPGLREARRVSARRADGVAEVVAPARHSVTEVLAAHAAALDLGALPARVRATAALLVLDTVGCVLGALALEDGRRLAAAVAAFGDAGPVTLWGQPGTAGPAAAAFVHGNLANFLDADETFRNFSHFCAGVVPAVLAAAEERNATGAQVVVATVAGYEVAARLALAIPSLTARPRGEAVEIGWSDGGGHSWLALAAAVGAGRIYNLDGEGLARAMGLAAFLAPLPTFGRWWHSFPMRMTKYMLYGATAQAGVLAARMAEDGVTGDGAILDGDGALWRMVGGVKFEAAPLLSPPGDPWWIDQAAFKLYPCSRLLHGALDGVAQVLGAARRLRLARCRRTGDRRPERGADAPLPEPRAGRGGQRLFQPTLRRRAVMPGGAAGAGLARARDPRPSGRARDDGAHPLRRGAAGHAPRRRTAR